MLLSRAAPTVIAQDRVSGARMLETMGVDVVVMDDGLQNPSIHPTASILVLDGGAGEMATSCLQVLCANRCKMPLSGAPRR